MDNAVPSEALIPRLSSSQGPFTVWEESPEIKTSSQGHQRQVFLFKDCVLLCKLKRDPGMNSDTYAFKNKMKVKTCPLTFAPVNVNVQSNSSVPSLCYQPGFEPRSPVSHKIVLSLGDKNLSVSLGR